MPILNLTLSSEPSTELAQRAAATLLHLTSTILHKAPALTSIAVAFVPAAHWYVGGDSLAQLGRHSFFLDIKVTDETNTATEKAAYIAAVYAAMESLLGALHEGTLHEVSYVRIDDARAAAWGYGGLSQQYRAVARELAR